jgi:(p)ppGpp synthase/HD superfamily hydrolase
MNKVEEALEFATKAHEGQFRKITYEPYINHPIMVSNLSKYFYHSDNTETVEIAALLHDTVEDTEVKLNDVYNRFGYNVAHIVHNVSHEDGDKKKTLANLVSAVQKDFAYFADAWHVFICDKLANLGDIEKAAFSRRSEISENQRKSFLRQLAWIESVFYEASGVAALFGQYASLITYAQAKIGRCRHLLGGYDGIH